jgi:pyridoxamine 5'-phosphate oxidase
MTDSTLIPPSPAEDEYVKAVQAADPLPLLPEGDPFHIFQAWLREAGKSEPNDPHAMTLATVDAEGVPDARMVLLKGVDDRGFVFFTNTLSAKGQALAAHPRCALMFHWKSLRRSVRIRGDVERVTDAEADAYFATRARSAQEKRVASVGLKFGVGAVPRPPHWSGYRVLPISLEFWRDRPFRLHERLKFLKSGEGWTTERLYP